MPPLKRNNGKLDDIYLPTLFLLLLILTIPLARANGDLMYTVVLIPLFILLLLLGLRRQRNDQ